MKDFNEGPIKPQTPDATSEAWKKVILENALDAVVGINQSGEITDWNRQAELTFGWTKEEALGRPMVEMIVPLPYREGHNRGMQHFLASGEGPILNRRIEIEALNRNGETFPVELTVTAVEIAGSPHFYSFLRDITGRKRSERALQDAIRSRDEFLSVASHELKTPISAIKMQMQMGQRLTNPLDGHLPPPDKLAKLFAGAEKQITRLAGLVEDLLDVSRIEAGRLTYTLEPINLAALVSEVSERYEEVVHAAGCRLVLNVGEAVTGEWDRFRIEQVVTNLLSNATKYGAGGAIEVGVRRKGDSAEITVKDYGLGIATDKQAKIFERYERAISASNISGLGLGLYITRTIVEGHAGSVTVNSELGRGSVFTVLLPMRSVAEERTRHEP